MVVVLGLLVMIGISLGVCMIDESFLLNLELEGLLAPVYVLISRLLLLCELSDLGGDGMGLLVL
jgi:hypothetical protein